ncbi:hypothetical protein AB4Y32_32135 [Paraburkholderia phymatum]|uniref:Uncharacterized protein n=1 Tax=Paraburkholderia phymatum TaxID=148447 RepID=A0ACC6U9K4_9BURK
MKISKLPRCFAIGMTFVSNVTYAHELDASLDCHFGLHGFRRWKRMAKSKAVRDRGADGGDSDWQSQR